MEIADFINEIIYIDNDTAIIIKDTDNLLLLFKKHYFFAIKEVIK